MLDTVKINHVQHISFTQSRLTDAVSVILSELLSYEHPSNSGCFFIFFFSGIENSREGRQNCRPSLCLCALRASYFTAGGSPAARRALSKAPPR